MIRKCLPVFLLLFWCSPLLLGQDLGDQYTAGFTNARTYTNSDLSALKPPLRLFETITLTGINDARSMAVYEGQIMVGHSGANMGYRLVRRSATAGWNQSMAGAGVDYVPALAGGIVMLGGSTTSSVKAVSISSGSVVWSDTVGSASRRYPAVTDDLVVYAGSSKVVARRLSTGDLFWQVQTTTAASPIAVFGNSAYFLDGAGALRALELRTGTQKWRLDDVGSDGLTTSIIASEKHVFLNDPRYGYVAPLDSRTGELAWDEVITLPGTFSSSPALALAHGRLLVFRSTTGSSTHAAINAYDANTSEPLWAVQESGAGIKYGFVANQVVYYYHEATERIRARDLATGTLIWSIPQANVRGLSAADGELIALLPNAIQIYRPTYEAFLAHMANGQGQSTLLALANVGSGPATATVEFINDNGDPVSVPVEGRGTVNQFEVNVGSAASAVIQTTGAGSLVWGWIRVSSDQPLRATSIFQYSSNEEIVREAGVGDAVAVGSANIFVSQGGVFNTGVAIANPTDEEATVVLTFWDGVIPPQPTILPSQEFTLGPGGHRAAFLNELLSNLSGTGTLMIRCDVPVVITALRTKDGVQISSYPVGQAVR
jgi:outer membrane protein assembly factor BamB